VKQVIIGQYGVPSTSTVYYFPLGAGYTAQPGNEADNIQMVSTAGVIDNLMVSLQTAPGEDKSYTFVLRVNGDSSALTVTISDTDTTGSDVSHEVTVAAGDRVCIMSTPSGTPVATVLRHSVIFEGTTAKQSLLLGGSVHTVAGSSTRYSGVSGFSWQATENDVRQVIPTAGKIKNLFVRVSAALTTSSYVFMLRKNGSNTTLTCTVVEDSGLVDASDTTHEVTVAAGDIVTFRVANSGSNVRHVHWGFTFEATVDGESILLSGTNLSPSVSATNYGDFFSHMGTWGTTESIHQQVAQAIRLKKCYIQLATAPGAGKSYTFTVRNDSVDTALSIQVSGTDTTGSDLVDTIAIEDWDLLTMGAVPADTPTSPGGVYWGIVCLVDVMLPSDDLARVTGIRHLYRPGLFRMQLMLGDVNNTIEIAEHTVRRELEIPEQPGAETPIGPPVPSPPPGEFLPPEEPKLGFPPFITRPLLPGIIVGIEEVEEGLPKVPSEPQYPPIEKLISKVWRAITPWKEEKDETVGTALQEWLKRITKPKKRRIWPWE